MAALFIGCKEKPKLPAAEKAEEPAKPATEAPPAEAPPAEAPPPAAEETSDQPLSVPKKAPPSGKSTSARPDAEYKLIALEDVSPDAEIRSYVEKLRETGKARTMRKHFERLKGKGSTAALLKAMRVPNANIRSQSATVLQRMDFKGKAFSAQLNAMLLSDPDEDVRGVAGRQIVFYQRHRLKQNTEALIEALSKDKTEAVQMHAAWALGDSRDRRGVDILIASANHESTDVRLRVVGALKKMGSKKAVPTLKERLADSNSVVRTRAQEALRKLTGKTFPVKQP